MAEKTEKRTIVIVASMGKKYRGDIYLPHNNLRTTDLFNSSSVYWKYPEEKCLENAIQVHNVVMEVDSSTPCAKFDKIQIKLSEVIYFYDDQARITNENEKKRATSIINKSNESAQQVTIVTTEVSNSFYEINGTFCGWFKQKANDKFIPLTNASVAEIYKKGGKWYKGSVPLPHSFICVSTDHIEAASLR